MVVGLNIRIRSTFKLL